MDDKAIPPVILSALRYPDTVRLVSTFIPVELIFNLLTALTELSPLRFSINGR